MARVYRETWTDKRTGKKRPSKWWHIDYVDAHGQGQRERVAPTKPHAEEILAQRLTDVASRSTRRTRPMPRPPGSYEAPASRGD